jgi:hypothetical protein
MASTDQQNTAAEPPPAKLPCFVKGLEAAFSGGVLGYVFGFGSKMVMFRGSGGFKARWAVSALEGKSCARTFATFGGIYAAAMCYSRRLRLKNDAIDGAVAGCADVPSNYRHRLTSRNQYAYFQRNGPPPSSWLSRPQKPNRTQNLRNVFFTVIVSHAEQL